MMSEGYIHLSPFSDRKMGMILFKGIAPTYGHSFIVNF